MSQYPAAGHPVERIRARDQSGAEIEFRLSAASMDDANGRLCLEVGGRGAEEYAQNAHQLVARAGVGDVGAGGHEGVGEDTGIFWLVERGSRADSLMITDSLEALELEIPKRAASVFAAARARVLASGQSVLHVEGNRIVRVHPDGRKDLLKTVAGKVRMTAGKRYKLK